MSNNRAIVPVLPHGGSSVGGGSVSNRMMTANTVTTHLPNRQLGTSSTRPGTGSANRILPPMLLCNLCQKPLATTCFLCACDCIFCEGEDSFNTHSIIFEIENYFSRERLHLHSF